MATPTIAFTRTSGIQQSSSVLGPIARNGLGYEEVSVGSGRRILPGDTVYCYYVGSFMEGTQKNPFGMTQEGGVKKVFDSVTEGEPFRFSVGKGEVIQGMDLGILGGLDGEIPPMYAGGKRNLLIPSRLAYGEQELGPIPANQDLEFELEILEATPRKSAVSSIFAYVVCPSGNAEVGQDTKQ